MNPLLSHSPRFLTQDNHLPKSHNSLLFLLIKLYVIDTCFYKAIWTIYFCLGGFKFFKKVRSAQSCLTLCDPMNRSMPGLPVPHQLPEFTQTQVHRVSDAIQPSHPLSSPFWSWQRIPAFPPAVESRKENTPRALVISDDGQGPTEASTSLPSDRMA